MKLAPIVLFVYNRPEHTRRTVEALLKNEFAGESELIVFSDGPKNDKAKDSVSVVREYIKSVKGFKKITIAERAENFGLAKSIIAGVTDAVEKYGRVIVMEDDMVSSPYFLRYMNEGLEFYENCDRVVSIHGYIYPVEEKLDETFFLKGADCWGWATWKRGWSIFEADGKKLLEELRERNLTAEFDFDGSYGFTQMLEHQIEGINDSWAIRWHASAFLKDKLTLYPGRSLIDNIGNDASGTHCQVTGAYNITKVSQNPVKIEKIEMKPDAKAFEAIKNYYLSKHGRPSPQPAGIYKKIEFIAKKIYAWIGKAFLR